MEPTYESTEKQSDLNTKSTTILVIKGKEIKLVVWLKDL